MIYKLAPYIVAAALLGAWIWRGHQLDVAQENVARVESEKQQLVADIEAQNQAVAELKAKAEEQRKTIEAAAMQAAKLRRESDARVRAIMAANVPADCDGAVAWGAGRLKELAGRWEN